MDIQQSINGETILSREEKERFSIILTWNFMELISSEIKFESIKANQLCETL